MKRAAALLLLAAAAAGLDPKEIYDAAAPATVVVSDDDRQRSGVVIHGDLVLTTADALVEGAAVRVLLKDGTELEAKVFQRSEEIGLALVRAGGLAKSGVKPLRLAKPLRDEGELTGLRVYTIGRPADSDDAWKLGQGLVAGVNAAVDRSGLRLLEHDAAVANAGSPVLDAEAQLLGVNVGAHKSGGARAIPVNAVRAWLAVEGVGGVEGLPPDALPVRKAGAGGLPPVKKPPDAGAKKEEVQKPPEPPPVAIPEGLHYGVYTHLIGSREKAALNRRAQKLVYGLGGLFRRCHTCKAKGTITTVVRAGFWLDQDTWVPPITETKTCPNCKGPGKLFQHGIATKTFTQYAHAEGDAHRHYLEAQERFVQRLHATQRSFSPPPRFVVSVEGRYGTVRGSRSNPLFPLHFKLLPNRRKYEWFLHDPQLNGPFGVDRGAPAGQVRVAEVAAADLLILQGGTVVRLCGIAVPGPDGKLPKGAVLVPDERLRKIVRDELKGKVVTLHHDKYTRATCDGDPLVFVELDGKDYGAGLVRRGLVRKHPRHKHSRNSTYMKTETEAKKAKVGIWAD